MAEQDLDRNQAATPYKLEKARERGQVAKSADVVSATVFISAIVFLTWQGSKTWQDQFRLDHALLAQAARIDGSQAALWSLLDRMLRDSLMMAAPFFATIVAAAIAGNVLQTGPVLSVTPVKADWSRVNPVAGLKRLLSIRTLFVGVRSLLKLALLGAVAWFSLKALMPRFFAVAAVSAPSAVRNLLDAIGALGFRMALVLAFIAILDLVYTRREFAKQMRMSRRELKDEVRHREGDPRIRARLRELRREMLKKSLALRKTRGADVLVTNPTHLAVALRYVHGQMASPQVIAKGAGTLAAAMRRIAARHGIPVVQNPTLARALFRQVAVEGAVPQELYAQVARIVVWVLAMRRARSGGAANRAARAGSPA